MSDQKDKNIGSTLKDSLSSMFTQSTILWLVVFLAIYVGLYFGVQYFYNAAGNPTGAQLVLSRAIDMFILITVLVLMVLYYYSLNNYEKDHLVVYSLEWMRNYFDDPKTIFYLIIAIVIFYILLYLCNVPMTYETRPFTIGLIESKLWILVAIQIILMFFIYVFNFHIVDLLLNDKFLNWIRGIKPPNIIHPSSSIKTTTTSNVDTSGTSSSDGNEVFNISNNIFTYDDAEAVCNAYDAQLATYDQVENSYNNGGEWCNYGWSANQMALFPTQKTTWNKLQETPGHENNCGRPGVNGGYIENPYVAFGVNCYGKKPKPTAAELAAMNAANIKGETFKPTSLADFILLAKEKFWKENAANLLNVNSYNTKKWSEY